ncbi:DNA sulfur modification protein DndD [Bacillus sp. SB49]|uniref:DNA sulfur modification protein DndD n=1 Tax=Bacillus sp. SB49 TaxID=1071080 RepID=UPI0004143817|nr:DNA sulfur modification protein DndD [Bacillus sp. SB49]QHT48498.1 DNA sulfur modification protein DndD [Bacillus sp. SB49]
MILKKIIINNIGPYEGLNSFNFQTKEDASTVLIGGKNGAGKTTFLNSVRIALYGPLAFGYKTVSNEYIKKIRALLNSQAVKQNQNDLKEYQNEFKVRIDFSMIENFQRVHASIIRYWDITGTFRENVSVIKNGVEVNEVEKDQFFTHLRTSFPPSLLELCFFDGEEISHLTDENNLSNYLKVLSSKIFNLDLFQNLEKDLGLYLDQSSKSEEQARLENDEKLAEEDLRQLLKHISELNEELENTQNELELNKQKYSAVKNDFSVHGGVAYDEREKIQDKLNTIEGQRKHLLEKTKEFIANELPFFIAFPTVYDLVEQLKNEEEYHVSNILRGKINQLPMESMLENLNLNLSNDDAQNLKETLSSHLVNTNSTQIIHNASNTEANQVYTLLEETNLIRLNEIIEIIRQNHSLLKEAQRLRKILKDNHESNEFNKMIESMEDYSRRIVDLEDKISSLNSQKEEASINVDNRNKEYERIKQQLYKIRKTKSSFAESQKIINISRKFQQQQLRNKLKDIEYFSSKMFKDLLRKKSFIKHIMIDPESFELTIIDHNNDSINKDILSAGEKELLALSIIWGTIKSSKKELPLILDTLLGRLDNEHKLAIISKLLPRLGVQNIVLSTDSEIDYKLYSNLRKNVANEYTLNYDNNNKKTNIERHFFNFEKEKVEQE